MILKDLRNYLNKISVFYFPEKAGYWNSITPCTINQKPQNLGRYYLDFSSKVDYPGSFSFQGIPLFSFEGNSSIEHPTVIAQYAFGIYESLFVKNYLDDALKAKYLNMADWFINNAVNVKGGKGWWINIDYYPEYKLKNPWISAMAQGEAISVLTRAAKLVQNESYERFAIEALGPFHHDVKDGGLVNYFKNIAVFEECPTPDKPMAVLNGFIFSLFGLYDLFLLNGNEKAYALFTQGINSINKILPYFDIEHWSQYYLFDYPKKYYSSYTYHLLVTEQLKALYYLSNDNKILEYHIKWKNYSNSFFNRTRALVKKITSSNKYL
jgi:hypothetical protein